jgi:YHS domain-containing protein
MVLSKLFYLKYKIKDPISGLKIYNVKKLKKINFQGKNLYFVNLVLDFLKKKFKTLSTEIKFNKRFDKPRVGGSFAVNLKIIKIILYCMVR